MFYFNNVTTERELKGSTRSLLVRGYDCRGDHIYMGVGVNQVETNECHSVNSLTLNIKDPIQVSVDLG